MQSMTIDSMKINNKNVNICISQFRVELISFHPLEMFPDLGFVYIYLYGETVRYENSGEPVDMKKVTFYENSKGKMYYFRNKS